MFSIDPKNILNWNVIYCPLERVNALFFKNVVKHKHEDPIINLQQNRIANHERKVTQEIINGVRLSSSLHLQALVCNAEVFILETSKP